MKHGGVALVPLCVYVVGTNIQVMAQQTTSAVCYHESGRFERTLAIEWALIAAPATVEKIGSAAA
jgi:hypothetical protein